jgi:hypothetical protein
MSKIPLWKKLWTEIEVREPPIGAGIKNPPCEIRMRDGTCA